MAKEEDTDSMASRRILVLGGSGFGRFIDSHRWDYIPDQLNVADYDTVILNFVPFEIRTIAESLDIDAIPSFRSFARLLFSKGSEIVVMGRPFFRIGKSPYHSSTCGCHSPLHFSMNQEKRSISRMTVMRFISSMSSGGHSAYRGGRHPVHSSGRLT